MTYEEIVNKLRGQFVAEAVSTSEFRDNRRIRSAGKLSASWNVSKRLWFDMLVEMSAADYMYYPECKRIDTASGISC